MEKNIEDMVVEYAREDNKKCLLHIAGLFIGVLLSYKEIIGDKSTKTVIDLGEIKITVEHN